MDNLPLWVLLVNSGILFLFYLVGLIINLIKLRKSVREFKSALNEMSENKINQMGDEETMKKIFCDKCGADITSVTYKNYNGYDLCDKCYEAITSIENEIASKEKSRKALLEQISKLDEELKNLKLNK